MRTLLAALAVLMSVAASAGAQTPAPAPPAPPDLAPVATATGPMPLTSAIPPCWPSSAFGVPIPGATGSTLYWGKVGDPMETGSTGSWYGWRCPPNAAGNVPLVAKLMRKAYKGPSVMTLVDEALTYPKLTDALTAMWAKYDAPCASVGVTPELLATCEAEMQLLSAAARIGLAPPPPPPLPVPSGTWAVAPYALSKTTPPSRPVFGFRAGRRIAQTYSTAEVGQPCRPEVASVTEGAVAYMAFGPAYNPAEVTVCQRK